MRLIGQEVPAIQETRPEPAGRGGRWLCRRGLHKYREVARPLMSEGRVLSHVRTVRCIREGCAHAPHR